MLFDEDFISNIESNPIGAIVDACNIIFQKLEDIGQGQEWNNDDQELLLESSALIETIIVSNQLHSNYELPLELTGDVPTICKVLSQYIHNVNAEFQSSATELKLESYKNRYKTALKSTFAYEFSQGDLEKIQNLINELRNHISGIENLESDHKRRLLKRLESLQSELHKRVSDLDRFWGMIGDAGVVLGKLGEDAKPIVDRVREISRIVWRTQARTEELPSDSPIPLLENNNNT